MDALPDESVESWSADILEDVGLTLDDLKDRHGVLDVGSGPSILARAAERHGVQVTSLELVHERLSQRPDASGGVVGDARMLPFQNGSFDLILSHGAAPPIGMDREGIVDTLDEMKRVLSEQGEVRIQAKPLLVNEVPKKQWKYWGTRTPEALASYEAWNQDAKDRSLSFLREQGYNVEEVSEPVMRIDPSSGRMAPTERRYWIIRKRTASETTTLTS